MAYNDYGAFVYLGGIRQRDHEDVTLGDVLSGSYDPGTAGGMAIYCELGSRLHEGEDGTLEYDEPSDVDKLRHAVLGGPGDGVYMTVYKCGFWGTHLFLVKDGRVADEMDAFGLRQALGLPEELEDGRDPMWEGVFDRSFEWHGWTVTCEMLDDDDAWRKGQAPNRARLEHTAPDGHEVVWDAFFGSAYGAGYSDVEPGTDDLFDELGDDGWPHAWHQLSLMQEQAYVDDEMDDDGRMWSYGEGPEVRRIRVTSEHEAESAPDIEIRQVDGFRPTGRKDEDGNDEERYRAWVCIRMGGRTYDVYGDELVSMSCVCQLLNAGIALGRAGIDHVDNDGTDIFARRAYEVVESARESGDADGFLVDWAHFKGEDGAKGGTDAANLPGDVID